MSFKKKLAIVAILALVVTGGMSASSRPRTVGLTQETGPVYPIEGVWYGMTTFGGPSIPSVDTMTANAQRPGEAGTFLCTVPAVPKVPNPLNPIGWLSATPSGQGSWVRVGTNRAAFTAVRVIVTESGQFFGWAKFWGTMALVSEDEITGTMNAQYYAANGTPLFPQALTGTVQRTRLAVIVEEQQ